jgi:glycerol uptake facilitator-like aquaporin
MPLLKDDTKENLRSTLKESFLILLYEMIGTCMLTAMVINYYYQVQQGDASILTTVIKDIATPIIPVVTDTNLSDASNSTVHTDLPDIEQPIRDNVGLLLGLFVTIMFSARISGSHFNPCITFSYMIGNVKHGNFDRILGFLYIAA